MADKPSCDLRASNIALRNSLFGRGRIRANRVLPAVAGCGYSLGARAEPFEESRGRATLAVPEIEAAAVAPLRETQMVDLIKQKEVLALVGTVVIQMQAVEALMKHVLQLCLPPDGKLSKEWLLSEEAANDKATIGRLCSKLRGRVDLDDDFDNVLHVFLEDRNSLIHDVDRIEGWDLTSDHGIAAAHGFLSNHILNTEFVAKVFLSLLVEWAQSVGIGPDATEMRKFLGAEFDGIAGAVFFAREPAV